MSPRPRARSTKRQFPRTARINQLLQEILAEELERIDDEPLAMVTITGVEAEPDLRNATVFFDDPAGGARDDEMLAALEDVRPRLQAAVNNQARLKRTPMLVFHPDAGVREGARIEEIIRDLDTERGAREEASDATGDRRDDDVDTDADPDGRGDGG